MPIPRAFVQSLRADQKHWAHQLQHSGHGNGVIITKYELSQSGALKKGQLVVGAFEIGAENYAMCAEKFERLNMQS